MLGNFSFGDWILRKKPSAGHGSFDGSPGMEPDRLYPSIYGEDDEAFEIWNKKD